MNAHIFNSIKLCGNEISCNDLQPQKAEDFPYSIGCPKLTSIYIDGEILEKNDELYDYFPYTKFGERKLCGNEISCNDLQPQKAHSPILSSLFGNVI